MSLYSRTGHCKILLSLVAQRTCPMGFLAEIGVAAIANGARAYSLCVGMRPWKAAIVSLVIFIVESRHPSKSSEQMPCVCTGDANQRCEVR